MTDDELLDRLRSAASEADPPPEHVVAAARAAHAWASLRNDLLELRFDSLVDTGAAGTRPGARPRVLRFATAECTAELELTGPGPVAVVGQVTPGGPGGVELTHSGGVARSATDELGRFALEAIPPGPASLAWTNPEGRRLRTSWVAI